MKNQENIKAVQAFLKEALENDGIFKGVLFMLPSVVDNNAPYEMYVSHIYNYVRENLEQDIENVGILLNVSECGPIVHQCLADFVKHVEAKETLISLSLPFPRHLSTLSFVKMDYGYQLMSYWVNDTCIIAAGVERFYEDCDAAGKPIKPYHQTQTLIHNESIYVHNCTFS